MRSNCLTTSSRLPPSAAASISCAACSHGTRARFELIEIENVAAAVREQTERLAAFDHYRPGKLLAPVFRSALYPPLHIFARPVPR
jgi:hypothetical protein